MSMSIKTIKHKTKFIIKFIYLLSAIIITMSAIFFSLKINSLINNSEDVSNYISKQKNINFNEKTIKTLKQIKEEENSFSKPEGKRIDPFNV